MAITAYSTDDDLLTIRPNILDFGVRDWEEKHVKAFNTINRVLIARWYKEVADEHGIDNWRETPFDPEKVDADQIKELSCYKTLELIYMHLMKDSPQADGFERQRGVYRDLYNEELRTLLATGLNYDWDDDDVIGDTEKYIVRQRRLVRV